MGGEFTLDNDINPVARKAHKTGFRSTGKTSNNAPKDNRRSKKISGDESHKKPSKSVSKKISKTSEKTSEKTPKKKPEKKSNKTTTVIEEDSYISQRRSMPGLEVKNVIRISIS